MSRKEEISKPIMTIVETGAGYRITQVGDFDYSDHFEAYHDDRPKVPRELVLEVVLPGIKKPSDIDAEVLSKSVTIKSPGVFRGMKVNHNLKIPLPYEVLVNVDYSASFGDQLLTLRLKVKPPKVARIPFTVKAEVEEPEPEREAQAQTGKEKEEQKNNKKQEVKEEKEKGLKIAKYSLTTEEKVVTLILYVPRAKEESFAINGNHVTIQTRDNDIYECDIDPPFPLRSKPVIKANPVNVYLIFVEKEPEEEETEKAIKHENQIPNDGEYRLRNKYIYELEPN